MFFLKEGLEGLKLFSFCLFVGFSIGCFFVLGPIEGLKAHIYRML